MRVHLRRRARPATAPRLAAARERAVQPILAVQVAVAARLDEAVREEAERGAGLQDNLRRLVGLVRLDPKREAARRQQTDRAVGGQHPDRGMPGARGRDRPAGRIDGQTDHRDEVPAGQLAECDLVRLRQERSRVGVQANERAEGELGQRHVRGGRNPVTTRVAEHDGELAAGQRQEVVDVTADLHPGRRLVDGADLEPLDLGQPARKQRALHRVGEVLSLLGQACVLDRQRGLAGDEDGRLDLLVAEPPRGIERDDGQRGEQLCRGGDRDDERSRAMFEERDEQLVRLA